MEVMNHVDSVGLPGIRCEQAEPEPPLPLLDDRLLYLGQVVGHKIECGNRWAWRDFAYLRDPIRQLVDAHWLLS